jgi:hypothetical protein
MVKKCANAIKVLNYLAYRLKGQTLTKQKAGYTLRNIANKREKQTP